jgi:hypothetical protein
MKHPRAFFSLVFALAAICWCSVQDILSPVVDLGVAAFRMVKVFTVNALQLAVTKNDDKGAAVVGFIQAKQFVIRIIKRERPVVSTEWRMCPST